MNDFLNNLNNCKLVKNENKAKTNGAVEKTFNNAEDLFDDWIYLHYHNQNSIN